MAAAVMPSTWGLSDTRNFSHIGASCSFSSEHCLFDIEIQELSRHTRARLRSEKLEQLALQDRIDVLARPRTSLESKLLRDVRAFKASIWREEGYYDTVIMASRLAAVGYRVAVRTAVGGGCGQACFRNLNYEFLLVSGTMECATQELVVDARFGEQFSIPQAPEYYDEVLRLAPREFVGPTSRLVPLLQLLCTEMGAAFGRAGLTCPPWRQAAAMMSKYAGSSAASSASSSARRAWGSPMLASPCDATGPSARLDIPTARVVDFVTDSSSPPSGERSLPRPSLPKSALSTTLEASKAAFAARQKSLSPRASSFEALSKVPSVRNLEQPPIRTVKMSGALDAK